MYKRRAVSFTIAVLMFIFAATGVHAAVYYVTPNGSDANIGSQAQPWKTIQKAANTLSAGDTVQVSSGTYNETITETSSGTGPNSMISYIASGAVTIRGFNIRGNYIKLKGFTVIPTDCGSWYGAIDISGSNFIVDGNIIRDSTRQGIVTTGETSGGVISNNIITSAIVNGMMISGTGHTVENNDISHISDHIGTCKLITEANGIDVHGSNHIFRSNHIHDFFKSDQSGAPHVDAFQTYSDLANGKPAAKNILIERNSIFMGNSAAGKIEEAVSGNQGFHAFMIEGSPGDAAGNITVRNNIIESWGGWNGNPGNVSNIKIYNNIWRSSLGISSTFYPAALNFGGVTGFEIYNNIFVDFSYRHVLIGSQSSGGSYDYNLMWNSDGSIPNVSGYAFKLHDKRGVNPEFILYNASDSALEDFHYKQNSPAIDTGYYAFQIVNDKDGIPRPQGAAFDIGAYEYISNVPTITSSPTTNPTNTQVCPLKMQGDADCNGITDLVDFEIWRKEFTGTFATKTADFSQDSDVNLADFEIWRKNFF